MTTTENLVPIGMFTMWLATGERGLSSEAIVTHLTGVQVGRRFGNWPRTDYPRDPDDFQRCERLLRAVPFSRAVFGSMRSVSPVWARLVDAWDELVAMAEDEIPAIFEGARGSAPLTYRRMRELIDGAA